jgi:ATP-binding cassette subfamily B protein
VSFRYPSGGFAIEALNLRIAPRERIGIVGPSGCGKTTLLRLLKREYEPQAGRVLIGGVDVAQCTLSSLAQAIAEVPQQVRLFNRTILENIAYGRPGVSEAELRRASQAAGCLELIEARASGAGADAGDDGSRLSGGERRRVAIARAVLKDAPILLLDEATEGLDQASEARVQQALERLMEGRTVIAVAHRLETLAKMDRIVVLAAGRIAEQGESAKR